MFLYLFESNATANYTPQVIDAFVAKLSWFYSV